MVKSDMDVLGVELEFNWVVKVLKSSKTLTQIDMSEQLFKIFSHKWEGILNIDQQNTFYKNFLEIKEITQNNLLPL
jgi:hypothetical protein